MKRQKWLYLLHKLILSLLYPKSYYIIEQTAAITRYHILSQNNGYNLKKKNFSLDLGITILVLEVSV